MKLRAFIDDREADVEVRPVEGGYEVLIDGQAQLVDCAAVDAHAYSLIVDHRSYDVSVHEDGRDLFVVRHGGFRRDIRVVDPLVAAAQAHADASGPAEVTAVMPGRVVKLLVEAGQEVAEGQGLLVLEAMKMENEVTAPRAGTVERLPVAAGDAVEGGQLLAVIV
ncbi:MAG: acetyl-CoA carboxylase biotin carboxyl carrier protein subunit [Acidobacteriota bacterium]